MFKSGLIYGARRNLKNADKKLMPMEEYYNINSDLIASLGYNEIKDLALGTTRTVNEYINNFYKNVIQERRIVEDSIPINLEPILKSYLLEFKDDGIYIAFNALQGFFDVIMKNKESVWEINNIYLRADKPTFFKVRDFSNMSLHGNEKFSIAFKVVETTDLKLQEDNKLQKIKAWALLAPEASKGKNSLGILKISAYDKDNYYIDNAAKYIEERGLLEGLISWDLIFGKQKK